MYVRVYVHIHSYDSLRERMSGLLVTSKGNRQDYETAHLGSPQCGSAHCHIRAANENEDSLESPGGRPSKRGSLPRPTSEGRTDGEAPLSRPGSRPSRATPRRSERETQTERNAAREKRRREKRRERETQMEGERKEGKSDCAALHAKKKE